MGRKYFGTDGIRGTVGRFPITPEFCLHLGWAVGRVFTRRGDCHIIIGKDTRVSGYMLESVLESGLVSAGADVSLLGPMPTPAIAYLTRTLRADAGIVISASHNPYQDNGIKFFDADGKKLGDAVEAEIEAQLENGMVCAASNRLGKAARVPDAPGRYIEFCKATVGRGFRLQGLKAVLDCAHGATYHVAPGVFEELGADIAVIGDSPDGFNINAGCGSTHPESLARAVRENGADIGIAFDGDGDRVIMVDHEGDVVDGDELLFIIADHRRRQGSLEGGVAGTVMSNFGLERALGELDIPFERAQVGDRHVHELLKRRGWRLGGESSGHILCLDLSTTGDGIIAALQTLVPMMESGKTVRELKQGMSKLPQAIVNVEVENPGAVAVCDKVTRALHARERRLAGRGRVLIRPSGTEPVIRVMVESEDQAEVSTIARDLASTVRRAG
ncbi:MAG: phosphoglucosamine mutase [Gammaproteobacteria bacterium]|nr:phosphoglucosamine mutase [Gammaproteobacteria bacterium]MDE0366991.1 phosphoglucosamine mutase [Gammaproteobacteria bacterium]